jgi:hypothetical protein
MRRVTRGAAVLVAGAATFSLVSVGSADAFTKKELKICWSNTSDAPGIDLLAVADGPSYRHNRLDSGECQSWDVQAGRYTLTVNNVNDFLNQISGACNTGSPAVKIRVKRQGHARQVWDLGAFINGEVQTNVRNNRSTSVAAHLRCV